MDGFFHLDDVGPSRRDTLRMRRAFERVRNAEGFYGRQLRKIADHVDDLVKGVNPTHIDEIEVLRRMLERYADILRPWAETVARRMLIDVARRDERAWKTHAQLLGTELRRELTQAPIGERVRELMEDQVHLITSLPREASQRIHDLVTGNLYSGARASTVAAEILRTGAVTKSRANLIARTETGRASISLMQARAEHIGSDGYVWRTAHDRFVRPRHRRLEGTFHRWTEPPVSGENGERSHPGGIYNCRCYAEPVIPEGM